MVFRDASMRESFTSSLSPLRVRVYAPSLSLCLSVRFFLRQRENPLRKEEK